MQRVWVTRDETEDGPLCTALRNYQLKPVLEPVLERVVVGDVAKDLQELEADDWLVLTSVFAIENVPVKLARIPQVAVVGEASKVAAEARGFRVELVSAHGTGVSLFTELGEQSKGKRVVYPRSALAKVPTDLTGRASFAAPILYETRYRSFATAVMEAVEVVSFTSASAVRGLDQQRRLRELGLPIASIGTTTTRAVEECGETVWVQPLEASFVDLACAIANKVGLSAT